MPKDSKYAWIAIDGCVGAGKTTLARVMAQTLKVNIELEKSDTHPFLEDFYAAPKETALETELGFVLIHYHQIARVIGHRRAAIVTDFTLAKDLIFARMNLSGPDLDLFRSVYNYFSKLTTPPTLLVKLDASEKLLWRRVKLRDRKFERNMKRSYLERLNHEYDGLPEVCGADRVLTLRADEYDIVNNEQDRSRILKQIAAAADLTV